MHDRPDLPCVVDADRLIVAQCWDDGHSESECEANARLISAAPDLAEALEAIMQAADSVKLRLCDDPDEYSDHEKHRALNNLYDEIGAARAALSKAGGLAGAPHD